MPTVVQLGTRFGVQMDDGSLLRARFHRRDQAVAHIVRITSHALQIALDPHGHRHLPPRPHVTDVTCADYSADNERRIALP